MQNLAKFGLILLIFGEFIALVILGDNAFYLIDLNDITNKKNNFLFAGSYGKGSVLLKTCFYLEMKNQRNCFKTKFQFQGKDNKK